MMKTLLVITLLISLSACQSFNKSNEHVNTEIAPEPLAYTTKAHPLGLGQQPVGQAHAFLLLGQTYISEGKRATAACRALFSDVSLSSPQRSAERDHVVTYFPVTKSGDFSRTSSRFNWAMCKRFASHYDVKRERALMSELGYGETRGPILVGVFDQNKRLNQSGVAVVADLSMVEDEHISTVIQNWLQLSVANGDLLAKRSDLDQLSERLNQGLVDRRVALSILPEQIEVEVASITK